MSVWQKIASFFSGLFGKKKAPQPTPVAPSPSPAPSPRAAAPAPVAAPVPAPSPLPAPPSQALPDGVLAIDYRGFAQLAAVEAERAKNPLWVNAPKWWAIEGLPNPSFTVTSNLTEAKSILSLGSSGAISDGAGAIGPAYAVTAGGQGFGYVRGAPYSDARSFIGDNRDQAGNVIYRGPRPSDAQAWVDACNANYQKYIANNYPRPQDAIPSTVFPGSK